MPYRRPPSWGLVAAVFCLLSTTSALLPSVFLFEKSCNGVDSGCRCIIRVSETKCCCMGAFGGFNYSFPESLTMLFLFNPGITQIDRHAFKNYPRLTELNIDTATRLTFIDARAFEVLPNLRKISIVNAYRLDHINGSLINVNYKLRSLIIKQTSLKRIPPIKMSQMHHHLKSMEIIDFSFNQITYIDTRQFEKIQVKTLNLNNNEISYVAAHAFSGSKIVTLNLGENHELTKLNVLAFAEISELHQLNLSDTSFAELPVIGLKNIKHLILKNVYTLKKLPPVLAFNNLNIAEFTYPYHCCFFKYATREYNKGHGTQYSSHYREIQMRSCSDARIDEAAVDSLIRSKRFIQQYNHPDLVLDDEEMMWKESLSEWINDNYADARSPNDTIEMDEFDFAGGDDMPAYSSEEVGATQRCINTAVARFYLNITCTPLPDALNPCEDIVGYAWLRYLIWVIWIMAIIGNILVWIVIVSVWHRRSRLHYFFTVNLSIADFCTGIYLGILAIQDARTANQYYNYAVEWQTGWGCAFAGFLSVFASELSIVSMLWIALEIYYNAKYAFYGRRITTRTAYTLMAAGYAYSAFMAALPLFGVSSYKRSSICLPLSMENRLDKLYLFFGLAVSALCFAGMIANYILINCMISNPQGPARAEDMQILRRSLLLVVTNMACWVPVLFFAITATLGLPLITLTNAKICLILFYPINSCANPFLYVFMTPIGSEAKKKAVNNLKRYSVEKSSVCKFYYANSPSDKNLERENEDEESRARFLVVTQTTSTNSSPRWSASSNNTPRSSTTSEESRRQSMVREVVQLVDLHYTKKRIQRVSAVPEMSDISEHSTNSTEEERAERSKGKNFLITHLRNSIRRKRASTEVLAGPSSTPFCSLAVVNEDGETVETSLVPRSSQDSGKGDSLKRQSMSSTEEPTSPRFHVQSLVIHKNKRRRMTEVLPTVVLSRYQSIEYDDGHDSSTPGSCLPPNT